MSKRKIGASLLTMMALVLMFSITTLAATGVTNLKATVDSGKITATWTDDAESTSGYTVTLKEGSTAVTGATNVPVDQGVGKFEYDVIAGKTYTVEVKTVNGTNTDAVSKVTVSPGPVTGFKVTVENGVLKALWAAVSDSSTSKYVVKVYDGDTVKGETAASGITETNYSLTVEKDRLYKVEVAIVDGYSAGQKTSLEIFAPPSNKVMTVTDKDNNLGNANFSGLNVTVDNGSKAIGQDGAIKDNQADGPMTKNDGSEGTHRTHGEYQNNTNSCASCHQTHTGASKSLLFKDGVYNTCTACHDGTLGMYNVFEHSNAGTFGGTTEGNMSVHLADGSVQVKAAPGGNLSANSGAWVNEFNCASCHSPHGSYSDRLLHYNPNGMGTVDYKSGGNAVIGGTILDGIDKLPSTESEKYYVVKDTAADMKITDLDPTATVIAVYEWVSLDHGNTEEYRRSEAPWLYGYGGWGDPKNYWTYIAVGGATADVNDKRDDLSGDHSQDYTNRLDYDDLDDKVGFNIEFSKGYAWVDASSTLFNSATKANISRAYAVKLDLVEVARFGDENGVPIFKSNVNSLFDGTMEMAGVKMSSYCSSCHTDYLAHSGDGDVKDGKGTGTYNQAYRHSTDSDSYTCVRCHYAHGTDVTAMMDAEGHDVDFYTTNATFGTDNTDTTDVNEAELAAKNYMMDQNPSSALKRYTNMSVCWGCHTDSKATQLKNTYSYGDDNDPHGLGDQPAIPGKLTQATIDSGTLTETFDRPVVSADDTANTIVGLNTTMEFSLNNGVNYTIFNGTNAPDLSGDKTVLVRVVAGAKLASTPVTLKFTTN